MTFALLGLGLLLLIAGAEALVRGGVAVARHFGVSRLLVGLTVVAYGTSAPELAVMIDAARAGAPGIALGDLIGSNIFNILAILGVTGLIAPIAVNPRAIWRDGAFALVAAALFVAAALSGAPLNRAHGVLFLLVLLGMAIATYWHEKSGRTLSAELHAEEAREITPRPTNPWLAGGFLIGGLVLLLVGSRLLVANAILLAEAAGISQTVIGLTLVAGGTSLPELATSVVAARRGHTDVALGNVIGSNIYNVLVTLGIGALIVPIPIPQQIVRVDGWLLLAVTLTLLPPVWMGWRIGRGYAAALLAAYAAYLLYLFAWA